MMRSFASGVRRSAAVLGGTVLALEGVDGLSERVRHLARLPLGEVDVYEGLLCGHHQHVVRLSVGGELERHARATDPGDADEDLDLAVDDCRSDVLDAVRAPDEPPELDPAAPG